MNKWIILIATILVTLGFAMTIQVTIANPSRNNLIISGGLLLVIFIGFVMFLRSGKKKVAKEEYTPIE